MTVSDLLSRCDSAELTEWMAWHAMQRDEPAVDVEQQLRDVFGTKRKK